jgi:outer membrane protein assembly factor BamB
MNQPTKSLRLTLAALLLFPAASLLAENWPHWRGPNFNGSSAEQNLPEKFSKTDKVKWVADLPGPSAATPIVWGDHVFVSSTDLKTKSLHALALDRQTGKELWNHEVSPEFGRDDLSNYASPSPVTDGHLVFFYYGNGELVAFDFAGKKVWSRNIQQDYGQFAFQWTYATSPTLVDGKLIIQVLQRDVPVNGRGRKDGPNDSYLLALEPATGKELWKHIRPSEARAESRESFATPIPINHDGKWQLLVAGGDSISAHELESGDELCRWGNYNPTRIGHWRLVPSPVANDSVALVCAPKGSPIYAVKLGGKGKLADSDLAWTSSEREVSSDVCTPLLYQGKFYVLNGERQTKTLTCVDPATGKPDWIGELGSRAKIECSPTGADGKIYFQNFRGEVFVISAGAEFKILHTTPMGDEGDDKLRSTIVPAQGNLFIRTGSKLYCVGK